MKLKHWHWPLKRRCNTGIRNGLNAPMRQISQNYNDRFCLIGIWKKLMLENQVYQLHLSSFFADNNVEPVFFKVSAGEVCRIHGPLQEGATETTNVIQGVELGKAFCYSWYARSSFGYSGKCEVNTSFHGCRWCGCVVNAINKSWISAWTGRT